MIKRAISVLTAMVITTSLFTPTMIVKASEEQTIVNNESNTVNNDQEKTNKGGNIETEESLEKLKENAISVEDVDQLNNSTEEELPDSCDNSTSDAFPEITNQIGNSCACYAITYYQMTYEYNKAMGRSAKDDKGNNIEKNVFSPAFTYNLFNNGNSGSTTPNDCYDILKNIGCASLEKIPFDSEYNNNYMTTFHAKDGIWEDALKHKISDSYRMIIGEGDTPITSPNDEDLYEIKSALSNGHILTFAVRDFDGFRGEDNVGYLESDLSCPDNDKYLGEEIVKIYQTFDYNIFSGKGHMMTIVGYNDNIGIDINGDGVIENAEKGAFKIANSHGTEYGNKGFIWLSYDALNNISSVKDDKNIVNLDNRSHCFDLNDVCGIIVDKNKKQSEACIEIVMNTNDRSKIKMGIEAKGNGEIFECYGNKIFNQYTGSIPINGVGDNSDAVLLFDLDSILDGSKTTSYSYQQLINRGVNIKFEDELANDGSKLVIKQVNLIDNVKNTKTSLLSSEVSLDGETLNIPSIEDKLEIKGITFDKKSPQPKNSIINMEVNTNNTKQNLKYEVTLTKDGKIIDGINKVDDYGKFVWNYAKSAGTYQINVKATNVITGDVATYAEDYELTDSQLIKSNVSLTSKQKSPAVVGDKIELESRAIGGIGAVTYKFYYRYNNGKAIKLTNYRASRICYWKPTEAGNYKLYVSAKDENGTYINQCINMLVVDPVLITSLENDKEFEVGNTIGFNISAKGGYNSLKYTANVIDKNNKSTNIVKDSVNNTFEWSPTESGTYKIEVIATDEAGNEDTYIKEVQVVNRNINGYLSVKSDSWARYTEDTILSVNAKDGIGQLKYKFGIVINNKEILLNDDYQESNEFKFKPYDLVKSEIATYSDIIGSHKLVAYVVDEEGNSKKFECNYYKIFGAEVNYLKTLGSDNMVGKTINIYASVKYPTKLAESSFSMSIIKDGIKNIIPVNATEQYYNGDYSIQCSGQWIPTSAGNYTIRLEYKDNYGQISSQEIEFKVYDKELTVELTSSKKSGMSIADTTKLVAKVVGGNENYTYRFGAKYNNKKVYFTNACTNENQSEFYENTSASFCPSDLSKKLVDSGVAAGEYTLFVEVKDSDGNIKTATIDNFDVKGMEVTQLNASMTSSQPIGTTINFSAVVENYKAYRYNYGYYTIQKNGVFYGDYTNVGGEQIQVVANGTNLFNYSFTPTEAGIYTITYTYEDVLGQKASKSINYVITNK